MTESLIQAVRRQWEDAEVEATVRDYRNGYVSYTRIKWQYGSSGYRAVKA